MREKRNGGFIGLIIVLIVALALLKYFFGFNIIEFLKSPKVIEVLSYIKKFLLLVWNKFLVYPINWLWNKIIVDIVWKALKDGFELLKGWVDSQG